MRLCVDQGWRFLSAMLLSTAIILPSFGDKLKTDTSLGWVPSSVGYYTNVLNLGQLADDFFSSNASARLHELSFVKMAIDSWNTGWKDAGDADLIEFLEDPENAELVKLLRESWRKELFAFGDQNVAAVLKQFNDFNRTTQRIQIRSLTDSEFDSEAAQQNLIDGIVDSVSTMKIPNLVFGFKVGDEVVASNQLGRIADLLREGMKNSGDESRAELIRQIEIEGTPFIQITLNSEMIPWDDISEDADWTEAQIEGMKKALSGKSVHFTIGVHDGYFLGTIGSLNNPLKLFRSKRLLIDRDEMAKIRKNDDKDVTFVSYVSETFMQAASDPAGGVDSFRDMATAFIPMAEFSEETESDLLADVDELAADVLRMIPQYGATSSFVFRTAQGLEAYSMNWSQNLYLDSSKKLDILNHIGGNPLAVFAARTKLDSPARGLATKWGFRALSHVQRISLEKNPDDEQMELFSKFRDALKPSMKRLGEIARDQWNDAMQDGQMAFVFDSKTEARQQWHVMMPAADDPLGMFEFASVQRISDRAKLEEAFQLYREAMEESIASLKETAQDNAAEIQELMGQQGAMFLMAISSLQMPNAVASEVEEGEMYHLPSLQNAGVMPGVAPTIGWSDEVLVMSNCPDLASRTLAKNEPSGTIAEYADKNIAGISMLDFAGLIDTVRPWVMYGFRVAETQSGDPDIPQIASDVGAFLDILKCIKSSMSIISIEDGATVAYSRSEISDL